MSPAKSLLFGLSTGLLVFLVAANVGGIRGGSATTARLDDTVVTGSLAPSAKQVPDGAKSSGTKLAQGANVLAPTPTPVGTTVAPVSPRTTIVQTATPTPFASTVTTATPTPVVPHTTTPTPTPITSPSPTPTPTPTPATPTPTPGQTQTPVPTPVGTAHVVINEIAWSGTASGSADEWIELYNSGTGTQELDGWSLCGNDVKIVTFSASHRIEQGQFFLIERTDDTTVSDIPADYMGAFGKSLVDTGLHVILKSGACLDGSTVDEVGPGAWYAGSLSPRASMERINASVSGTESTNWATWGTIPDSQGNTVSTGLDAGGSPIKGTPKFKNSVTQ